MSAKARLLVIGPGALRDAVARTFTQCEVAGFEQPLAGVWQSGQQSFEGVFLSLSMGKRVLPAIRALRQIAPQARIVVTCSPTDEPLAQRAIQDGADEYLLEPLRQEDLEQTFEYLHVPRMRPRPAPGGPSLQEIVRLSEVLRNLEQGPAATLEQLAKLLQLTFCASGVLIQIDTLTAIVGDPAQPVLEELLLRQDQPVGRIALARRESGSYDASTAARLVEYARLVEATIAQARERERWRDLAWTDDLSGLRNRRYFDKALDELIARAIEERLRLTVLLFDIDDLKTYNDRYGHEAGDELIREIGLLLRRCTRETDVVARYGGDEFAVIFWDAEKPRVPGSQHPREPSALVERFQQAAHEQRFKFLGDASPGPVTTSGGLACFPWDGATREQLLRAADEALRAAKRTGKNRIELAGGSPSEPRAAD